MPLYPALGRQRQQSATYHDPNIPFEAYRYNIFIKSTLKLYVSILVKYTYFLFSKATSSYINVCIQTKRVRFRLPTLDLIFNMAVLYTCRYLVWLLYLS